MLICMHKSTIASGERFSLRMVCALLEWAGSLDIVARFYCKGGANVNAEVKRAVCII